MLGFFVVRGTACGFLSSAANTVEEDTRMIAHIISKTRKIVLVPENCIDAIFTPPSNAVWFLFTSPDIS
jgi:hypothetical protein